MNVIGILLVCIRSLHGEMRHTPVGIRGKICGYENNLCELTAGMKQEQW